MSEFFLFICAFSITCGLMKPGTKNQNKKLVNIGLLGLFMWVVMFIWTPFTIGLFNNM